MANARVHINLQQGLLEAEGSEEFVLKIYEDFKNRAANSASGAANRDPGSSQKPADAKKGGTRSTARGKAKKAANAGEDGVAVSKYIPKRDSSLNLADLKVFAAAYKPVNAAEKILLYAQFLREKLRIEPCTVDQIYTCFLHMKDKTPSAFGQVFINARGNAYGYVDFTTVDDVKITIAGDNHFNHDLPKAQAQS